jgi:hypothetical protein
MSRPSSVRCASRNLVGSVPLTALQLLSLIATDLSPAPLVAAKSTGVLTALASLTSALRYAVSRLISRKRLLTALKSFDVARSCAKNDPDQWDAVLRTLPCVRALIADFVAATLEPENAGVKGITFDIRPSGSDQGTSATQDLQRSTPSRDARLKRRAVVAGLTANRNTQDLESEGSAAPASQKLSDARPETYSPRSFTPVVNKASPLSKREPTQRPKWQPTTCTAPGVTCGNGGIEVPVLKQEIRSDARSDTKSPSLRLATCDARPSPKIPEWWPTLCMAPGIICTESDVSDGVSKNDDTNQLSTSATKREAQPAPKLPKWFPNLCTTFGITCGESGTSNDGSPNKDTNQPPDSATKREAKTLPEAEARPVPEAKHPKWKPTSCTARGMTCGHVDHVEDRGASDDTGTDGASISTKQSATYEYNKKRDLDASHVWSGPGRSVFTDDEGNAVRIEDDTTFAT